MRNRALWFVLIPVISFAAQNPAPAQENRGTLEQQLACTPDVFRLCGAEIPDENRIVACLRQNTAQLDEPCKAVFEAKDSVPQDTARKHASH
jgi:hypothetical protein